MAFKAYYKKHILKFRFAAGTSRGVLHEKNTYYLIIENDGIYGIGECSTMPNLSIDDVPGYEKKLQNICSQLNDGIDYKNLKLEEFPSIRFGIETALLDLKNGGKRLIFQGDFADGNKNLPINGLIWMGEKEFMLSQINEKLDAGFNCLKLKIGALDFETEIDILKKIRKEYSPDRLEIRLDANGTFSPSEAPEKIERLSKYYIHALEQPIKAYQYEEMAKLCAKTPVPIALDEELIGNFNKAEKLEILQKINPHYIIIKPSLIGGFENSEEWISMAEKKNIGWWATSALESNIGLNAIAQWVDHIGSKMVQGLGTGMLYHNNIPSPLVIKGSTLHYDVSKQWDISEII